MQTNLYMLAITFCNFFCLACMYISLLLTVINDCTDLCIAYNFSALCLCGDKHIDFQCKEPK